MLFPRPQEISVADAYGGAHRTRRRGHGDHPGGRPWVVLTMISTADGATAIDGNSAKLGGPADREVFLHLHRSADCVLVGAQTIRQDSYSPLPAHQKLVVLSNTGDLGANTQALLDAGNTQIVTGDIHNIVHNLSGNICVLEGGSHLNNQMLQADLIDEICLTIAPMFVGGTTPRIFEGEWFKQVSWTLAHICQDSGFVFLRYLRSE
jgi:riboflavin biosynthesis pyrimidine reductase